MVVTFQQEALIIEAISKMEVKADKWCEELLPLSPGCLEIAKATFNSYIDLMPKLGVHSSMLYPNWFDTEECSEGIQAFMEKRKPDFWKARKAQINK